MLDLLYEHFLLTSAKLDLPKETFTRKTSFPSSQKNKYQNVRDKTEIWTLFFKCCLYCPTANQKKKFFSTNSKSKKKRKETRVWLCEFLSNSRKLFVVSENIRKLAWQLLFLEGNKSFFLVSPKEKKTTPYFYMATTNFAEKTKDLFFSKVFLSKKKNSGGRWFTRNSLISIGKNFSFKNSKIFGYLRHVFFLSFTSVGPEC